MAEDIGKGLTILILDDEQIMSLFGKRIFEKEALMLLLL